MSEFVLKLAGWDRQAPVVWLPGVTRVKRMAHSTWGEVTTAGTGVFDDYDPDLSFMSNVVGRDMVVTLIWIESASYSGYAVVERAWLVGPGGGTVDRISESD